ncbi:hypothetical protein SeMB42_g04208 [Synchytrium endobioticum]|uniref:Uncharacterized protein n=1 Tax=Synchytrium endobioticum TaxID=286115 RepID=A0A507D1Z5_9FUNG|nr:hypothetical protein SeMB42_g04208 [Synchytrium endobioticum]TPX45321.1 hypothetical protein SeLEV6574_g03920 [Synchytrium endobioticum]
MFYRPAWCRKHTTEGAHVVVSCFLHYVNMATVLRQLYGHHPSFLKQKTVRNLLELCILLPNQGVGVNVTPADWYKSGWHDSYWTIASVELNPDWRSGTVWGIQTWKSKTSPTHQPIPRASVANWHLHQPPEMHRHLANKLGIDPSATFKN